MSAERKSKLRLGRLYTRGGDKGTTALVGGQRVSKGVIRVEAYGSLDELNAVLGLVRTVAEDYHHSAPEVAGETAEVFRFLQNRVFDAGSILATPPDTSYPGMPRIKPEDVSYLEARVDRYNEILGELRSFTLPGGGMLNAHAHLARTVCRRAERAMVRLSEAEPVDATLLAFINRLSDYLFAFTRWVSKKLDEKEYLWEKPGSGDEAAQGKKPG